MKDKWFIVVHPGRLSTFIASLLYQSLSKSPSRKSARRREAAEDVLTGVNELLLEFGGTGPNYLQLY